MKLRMTPIALALCAFTLPHAAWAQAVPTEAARSDADLPPIKVTAKAGSSSQLPEAYAGGQVAKGARLGALGNQDVMDTPFNITSYTSDWLESQQARTLAEALGSDPSVRFTTSAGHQYENFRVRGFDVNAGDIALDGLFGLAPVGHVPLELVERVEVLKGPSALFGGMPPGGAVGGVINLVLKRAGDEPLNRASVGYQSEGQLLTSVDIGRRFGEQKEWGVRVNAAYADGDTELDGQSKKRELLAAALDYRHRGLTASLDAFTVKESYKGGSPAMFWFDTTQVPAAPDASINQFPAGYGTLESHGVIARVEYAFNRQLSAFASAGVSEQDAEGFVNGTHVRYIDARGTSAPRLVSGRLDGTSTYAQRSYTDAHTAEAGLRATFGTGPVRHDLLLHASQLAQKNGSGTANGSVKYTTNIYTPAWQAMPSLPTNILKTNETKLSSVALVDTMSLLDDALRLTVGLRDQKVKTDNFNASGAVTASYDKSAVTPAVAVVFKPWGPDLSLYANRVQGLSKGDSVTRPTYTIDKVFAPYKTDQIEAGVKWNAGTFTHTAALFEISKPMLIKINGNEPSDGGEKRVRGLEWNTFGEVVRHVRLLGGATYTDGVQTKTANNQYNGKTAVGAPRWQGNLGAEWDTPWVSGLSVSGRVQATTGQYLDSANTIRIPGWAQLDAGAAYTTRMDGKKLVLRLNVANLLDHHYYSGSFSDSTPIATLGQARTVMASATMDF